MYTTGYQPAIIIAPSCSSGFTPDEGRENNDTPEVYTFAYEDTFMGDYDMNDVVLQVWEDPEDNTKLYVKLCCAGASYDLYVFLRVGEEDEPLFGGQEVHIALNGTPGKYINTGTGEKFETCEPYLTRINKPDGYTPGTADFWVKSPAGDIHVGTEGNTKQIGNAPYGVRIPKAWAWPNEWVPVSTAYEGFTQWAADKTQHRDWYDHPVEGNVRTR